MTARQWFFYVMAMLSALFLGLDIGAGEKWWAAVAWVAVVLNTHNLIKANDRALIEFALFVASKQRESLDKTE